MTSMLHHRVCNNLHRVVHFLCAEDNIEYIKECRTAINILESEDGLGLADSVGVIWKYRGIPYNVEMLKFMVRTLIYFPTLIADSWVVILYISMLCRKMYTCSSNGSQSGKICIGSHEGFVYR